MGFSYLLSTGHYRRERERGSTERLDLSAGSPWISFFTSHWRCSGRKVHSCRIPSKDVQCTSLPKSSYLPKFLYPYLYSIPELDSIGRLKDTKNTTGVWSSSVRQRSLLQSTVWQLYGPGDPQQWFTVGSLVHFWCPSYHITYIHLPVPYYLTYLTISCHQNHHCIDHPAISSNSISLEQHRKCMAPSGPCGLALGFDISDQLFQLILREFLHPLLQLWLGAWALPLPPDIRSQLGIIIQGPNETGPWIMFEIVWNQQWPDQWLLGESNPTDLHETLVAVCGFLALTGRPIFLKAFIIVTPASYCRGARCQAWTGWAAGDRQCVVNLTCLVKCWSALECISVCHAAILVGH